MTNDATEAPLAIGWSSPVKEREDRVRRISEGPTGPAPQTAFVQSLVESRLFAM